MTLSERYKILYANAYLLVRGIAQQRIAADGAESLFFECRLGFAPPLNAGRWARMLKDGSMQTPHLLEHLTTGDMLQAFESAKVLPHQSRVPITHIAYVLQQGVAAHNRQAAAYVLAHTRGTTALLALLACANNPCEVISVRAQALESIATHGSTPRHKMWKDIQGSVIHALTDPAPELRFWACYTAGILRMRAAIPYLQTIAATDSAVYPGWWSVAEEAADALAWMDRHETPDRARLPTCEVEVVEHKT